MSKEQRRIFSKEYKLNAVRRAEAHEQSQTQIARELGISVSALQTWKRQFKSEEADAGPSPSASKNDLEEENRRLRRENASLREDREILKKAAAFFAKEPQ